MCGIIGYLGEHQAVPIILEGLRRLEYRGYDSAGIALVAGEHLVRERAAGKLINLEERLYKKPLVGTSGIGHTRWATHGAPTEENAHPHLDSERKLAVVHNGIIENFVELRTELQAAGVELESQTDTELVAHLLAAETGTLAERAIAVRDRLIGQYAMVLMSAEEPNTLVVVRDGPPMCVGLGDDESLVASDPTALVSRTRRMVVLHSGDVGVVTPGAIEVFGADGRPVERLEEHLDWDAGTVEKGGYRHFMAKEIHEQPEAVRETVMSYLGADRHSVSLKALGLDKDRLDKVRRVHLLACGTSWHAALVGKFLIENLAGIPTEVDYASEYRYRNPLVADDVLALGITQSGETADTMAAMELAKGAGALLGCICNARGSSAWRLSDIPLLTHAGPEIGVASTKAFTTQLALLTLFAMGLARRCGSGSELEQELVTGLQHLPVALSACLDEDEAYRRGVEMIADCPNSLFLGRGPLYPIALEGALKLKEISYLHAEGYPAGEMKHGPIALIHDGFPVIAVATSMPGREKLVSNLMEVRARGARVIAVSEGRDPVLDEVADLLLPVPKVHPWLQPIAAVIPLQRLAYEVAVELGLDVDQPRNLAKSVTVE